MNKDVSPFKILLVQLFSNGDCLYATTVARQIKNDFPGCHLTWAIASSCKKIISGNPHVDDTLEIDEVKKNDVHAFRELKKKLFIQKKNGLWQEVFITHIMDDNQANYDGCIRSAIFRGYPRKITVDSTPVISLSDIEKQKAAEFAQKHSISKYKSIILFEFAPQSGQLAISKKSAIQIAEKITENSEVAIILSSAQTISHSKENIIDGSSLTLRETAALSFYCTHLIGCSSGITWLTTSDGAKMLPMIQILNPYTDWVNPISRDFIRRGQSTEKIIELIDFNEQLICECVAESLINFSAARKKYTQQVPLQFKTTRKIIYNLLCYLQFRAIAKHIRINLQVYGFNSKFFTEVLIGLVTFPFKLIKNLFTKRIASAYNK
ncbi:MAG: hypothetical protein QM802_08120 [Agriterribacter sp.]